MAQPLRLDDRDRLLSLRLVIGRGICQPGARRTDQRENDVHRQSVYPVESLWFAGWGDDRCGLPAPRRQFPWAQARRGTADTCQRIREETLGSDISLVHYARYLHLCSWFLGPRHCEPWYHP